MQARKLTLVEIGVGGLPSASPVAPRFSTWFPVPFKAPDVPPANGVNPTPVADGVVLEWDAVDLEGVIYVISRSESQDGPWTEIHRTTETRYVYSDGSGKTWWFQITPTVRGKTGTGTVVGVVPPTTSKDLAEQQAKLAAEISARIQAIADEAAARAAGLAQAAQDLVAEALLRQQGVTEAMQAISAEAQARIDALLNEKMEREAAISREEQLRQSADESLARAVSEVAAGSGTQFDSIKLWPFNQTIEGWTGNGAPTLVDGWLRPANHATAPWVQSPVALAVDGSAYRFVKLRVKRVGSPTWNGFLQWITTTDQAWNTQKRVAIPEPAWDVNGVATVDVQDIAWWPATVDAIRLQLGAAQTVANYYLIDYIAVGRPQPGASVALVQEETQARITADAAEALQRNTLAAQMRGNYTGTDPLQLTAGLAYEELKARVAADAAQVQRISTMEARMPAGAGSLATAASVTTLQEATATTTSALAQSITTINAALPAMITQGSNMVLNGSWDQGNTVGWSYSNMGGVSIVAEGRNGKCLKVTAPSGSRSMTANGATDRNIPVVMGKKYRISAYYKTDAAYNGTSGNGKIRIANQDDGLIAGLAFAANRTEWTRLESTVTATTISALRVYVNSDHTAGTLWVDDVVLEEVTELLANAQAISDLSTSVTQLGDTVTSQAGQLTALRSDLTGVSGRTDANTLALTQLTSRTTTVEGKVETVGTSVTKLEGQIQSVGGDNLLWNSSMEDAPVATAAPTGWNLERIRSDVGGTFSYVDSSLSGGGKAVRLDWTAVNAKDWVGLNRAGPGSNYVKVDPNTDYTLSSWVRGAVGTKAQLYVQWMNDSGGTVLGTVTLLEVVMTSQWQRLILPARSRGDAVRARVYVGRQFADQAGSYWLEIDNVQFQRGLVATEYRPSGQEAINVTTQNVSAVSGLTTRMVNAENKATSQADQLTSLTASVNASFNRGDNINTNSAFDGSAQPFALDGAVEWVSGGGQVGSAIQMTHVAGATNPAVRANRGAWSPLRAGTGRRMRTVIVARATSGSISLTARCRVRTGGVAGEGNNDQTTPVLTTAWQRFALEHPIGDDRTDAMSHVWATNRGTGTAVVLVDRIEFYDVTDELLISANASATAGLITAVNQQGSKLDATAQDLVSLKTQVGNVNSTAFNQMQTTVQQHEGKINANASAIQSVQAGLSGKADATVVQDMQATVRNLGGQSNLIPNSTFPGWSASGWAWLSNGYHWHNLGNPTGGSDWNPPGVFGLGSVSGETIPNNAGDYFATNTDIAVEAGKTYCVSAYLACHRSKVYLYAEFFNQAGDIIAQIGCPEVVSHQPSPVTLDSLRRVFGIGKAPPGAVKARVVGLVRGTGEANPYWWIFRPMLSQVEEGATQPPPWSSGGMESSTEWSVDMRADGYIAGVKLGIRNQTSEFNILADKLRVSSPSGGQRTEYSDGNWRVYDGNGVLRVAMGVNI
ncbi:carbohydrate binding domain-containing protein [Stenotrophomonas sp. GD03958]|uniref:carbohydrate binding domain-containing protein n=1 Tax=Stenotrophomonas sp. GD03958 TaxID=2975411 RepID=UPI00244D332D|nr:carbohydrate binding domain-containing protein [Stenotrophomonas sp. GD03958]MDH1192291.1 carbohydrate binding domain-containing protein [Stenotrophomonas sp. GD03958]